MIELSDLTHMAQVYPQGTVSEPRYVFAGGTAVKCLIGDAGQTRKCHDIDLVVFASDCFGKEIDRCLRRQGFHRALFADRLLAGSQSIGLPVEIVRGMYFDSEVLPIPADAYLTFTSHTLPLLTLSPEFVAVSKLSYPNVHRIHDFDDVLALAKCGLLSNSAHLSSLLSQTSLSKLISIWDVLDLESSLDLRPLLQSIRRQLIRRFLYWDYVAVESLTTPQMFVLLDVSAEMAKQSPDTVGFINTLLAPFSRWDPRALNLAKLGISLILMALPHEYVGILENKDLQTLLRRGLDLIPRQPNYWLARTKSVFAALRGVSDLEQALRKNWFWEDTLCIVVRRIFFEDPSRFLLLGLFRSLSQSIKSGEIALSQCTDPLSCLDEFALRSVS